MPDGRIGRGVTSTAAIKALLKLGFEVDRIKGSHYIIKHPDGRRVTVPRHGVIKPGLLLNQLKKIDVSWEEFKERL